MQRFEDSIAWQKARALNRAVYEATRSGPGANDWGFTSQIRRASISIMNNIAEGFERNRPAEFHQFLSIAKGSCAEVRSMLYAGLDIGYLKEDEFGRLKAQAEEVTRVVAGLRASVQRAIEAGDKRRLREDEALYDPPFEPLVGFEDTCTKHSALRTTPRPSGARLMPLVIGLTGTIAAGKSTVAQILGEAGAVHCDADKLVHRLYDPGTPGFDRVVAAFGEDIIGADGYIDRKVLGAKVFGKPAEMNKLTTAIGSITDAIKAEIDRWREELGPNDLAVMEAVNLMEPGYARWCDQTWLIGVDDDVAKKRLIETRDMAPEEADQRLKSMVPFDVRRPGADWGYKNNGSLEELRVAVLGELERIRELHRKGELPGSVFEAWWGPFIEKRREALKASGQSMADEKDKGAGN